jgi:hypothetical protein
MISKIQLTGFIFFLGFGYFYANAKSVLINSDISLLDEINTPNLYFNYTNVLGNAAISTGRDSSMSNTGSSQNVSFIMLGDAKNPLKGPLGFETMCLSYTYKANKNLMMALSLFRHVF